MKNKEKYARKIAEIACDTGDFAIDKNTGHMVGCDSIQCKDCLFDGLVSIERSCYKNKRVWAESEYTGKPFISKKDLTLLNSINEWYEYITRDDNGWLWIWCKKPSRTGLYNEWYNSSGCPRPLYWRDFDFSLPMVKWEDEEPWLIEDLKKLEVVDEY